MAKDTEKFVTAIIDNMVRNGATAVKVKRYPHYVELVAYRKKVVLRTHDLYRSRGVGNPTARLVRTRREAEYYKHWVKLIAGKMGVTCLNH